MKRFLKNIALFSIPLIVVMIAMEVYLRSVPNIYSYKDQYLKNQGAGVKTLILGSSHAYFGVNPEFMDSTFNAAYVSQSLYFDYLLLEKYLDGLPNLQNVVLTISQRTYTSELDYQEEKWRKYNYYHYMGVRSQTIGDFSLKKYSILANTGMKKTMNLINDDLFFDNNNMCSSLGWGKNMYDGIVKHDFELRGKPAAERHIKSGDNFELGKEWMNKIIDLLKIKGVSIILIDTPKHETYLKHIPLDREEKIKSINLELAKKHSNVLCFKSKQISSADKQYFFDPDHLNEYGAEKFSRELNVFINHL